MKGFSATALVTLALALACRAWFRFAFPGTNGLSPGGTYVVVVGCAVIVLSSRRLWRSLRKRKVRNV
jgi:hypothetical protein